MSYDVDSLERIARLALRLLDVPIAAIVLADSSQSPVIATGDSDFPDQPPLSSFARPVLDAGGCLVAENLQADRRLAAYPAITGQSHFKFLAGQRLEEEAGRPGGAFLILDRRPRTLDEAALQDFKDLAALVCASAARSGSQPQAERPDQAGDELQASIARYETVIAALEEGIIVQDAQTRIISVNAGAERIFGAPASQLNLRYFLDPRWKPVHEDGRPFHIKTEHPALIALQTGQPQTNVVLGLTRLDDRQIWLNINSQPLYRGDQLIGVVSSFNDITRSKLAEDNLKKERDFISAVLDVEGSLVVVVDRQGRIVRFNHTCEAVTGYTFDEVKGQPFWDLFLIPEEADGVRMTFEQLTAGQFPNRYENHWLHKDGTKRLIEWSNTALLDTSGQPEFIIGTGLDITDRKAMEDELQQQRDFALQIMNTMGQGLTVTNNDGLFEYVNPAYAEMLGYRADELIGKTPFDVTLPEDHAALRQARSERKAGHTTNYETRLRHKDGYPVYAYITSVPYTRQNRVNGTIAVVSNMTHLKQAEEALQRSHDLLQAVIEGSSEAIYVKDLAGRYLLVNSFFAAILNRTTKEVIGRTTEELWPVETAENYLKTDREVIETGQSQTFEINVTMQDGQKKTFLSTKDPYRDMAGNIAGIIGVARDISDRIRTEEAYRRSETNIRALLNAIPDLLVRLDETGRILYATEQYGYEPLARLSQGLDRLIGDVFPELAELATHYVKLALHTRSLHNFEFELDHPQGVRDYEARVVPGNENEALLIIRDVSERKRLDRLKNDFVSLVSHELRTPLTAIHGSLGLLAGGITGQLPDEARMIVDIAVKNTERLSRLINDILNIEKIEAGKMHFHLQPVEIMSLVDQALQVNRSYGELYGVEFVKLEELPAVRVNADSDRIIQVLTNLLSNAAKFSQRGDRVAISVTRNPQEKTVRVAISDRGPGIPDEFKDRIFQKFAQADTPNNRNTSGSGLGLSIAKGIIDRHGGRLGFNSAPGRGTTFYFELAEWPE